MSGNLPPSGDPFAAAYATNGAARPNPQQALAQQASRYKGYGFAPPGSGCPPSPGDALEECVRAAQQVLANTTQRYQKMPWIDPSFRARPLQCDHRQVVLSTSATFNAATNASGLLLQAANEAPGFDVALLEMDSGTDAQPIFSIEPQQGYMARIKSWGVSFGPSGPKAVTLRAKGSTVGGSPNPPSPFVSGTPADQHQDAFFILQPKQTVTIEAVLNDPTAGPVLIDFAACFWLWPINKRMDSPEGSILRSGYGVDCP
jgi:hypothetical protein